MAEDKPLEIKPLPGQQELSLDKPDDESGLSKKEIEYEETN